MSYEYSGSNLLLNQKPDDYLPSNEVFSPASAVE
jgi:hypothetical protein